ncbi:MAG TPA: hypothetical protein VIK51_07220 [Vicinamibacteria bacterium]|jgi:hypothetical protein
MIGPFRRRSSWPSSVATGLIGWVGFAIIVPLALGYTGPLRELFFLAVLAAVVQVAVLRAAFTALRLDRGPKVGATWGGLTAALIVAGEMAFSSALRQHPYLAMATGVYVGIAVGGFLSYFHLDDRSIQAEARNAGRPVDYGRDAHWLDPFVYGALAYEVAFLPRTPEVAISAAVVGMIVGVVAAGVSHFILSRWGNTGATVPAAALVGAALGTPTGFLFRTHAVSLLLPPVASGAIAGALTFLVTAVVGSRLALRERGA